MLWHLVEIDSLKNIYNNNIAFITQQVITNVTSLRQLAAISRNYKNQFFFHYFNMLPDIILLLDRPKNAELIHIYHIPEKIFLP